jgi:hypothetical protein
MKIFIIHLKSILPGLKTSLKLENPFTFRKAFSTNETTGRAYFYKHTHYNIM